MLHIDPAHLCYQLVLWQDQMDPANPIEIWVITRAIYGTISSGNQAEVAIRRGASHFQKELPEGAHTIINETYVDDGMPGRDDPKQLNVALEQVQTIFERIGFNLKCTVVSGQKVPRPLAMVRMSPSPVTTGSLMLTSQVWLSRSATLHLQSEEQRYQIRTWCTLVMISIATSSPLP